MNNIELKMAELNKKFKADIINMGTDIIQVDKIPFSSPTANYMTYGGVPVGKVTEFFGGEGGGKTTSALDICANAQVKFAEVFDKQVAELEEQIEELNMKGTKDASKKASRLQTQLDEVIEKIQDIKYKKSRPCRFRQTIPTGREGSRKPSALPFRAAQVWHNAPRCSLLRKQGESAARSRRKASAQPMRFRQVGRVSYQSRVRVQSFIR